MAQFPKMRRRVSLYSKLQSDPATRIKEQKPKTKTVDKSAWRVIAPYMMLGKRKGPSREEEEDGEFSYYLKNKPSVLIRERSDCMYDNVEIPTLFTETAKVLKTVTKSAEVNLYIVDESSDEIYLNTEFPRSDRHKVKWKIETGTTVAAYAAKMKEYIAVEDLIYEDERFPDGIGYEGNAIPKSVLAIPIVTPEGDCFAVIELVRRVYDPFFTVDDIKLTVMVAAWMGIAIHQNQERLAIQRHQELNDYLLQLVKCYFGDNILREKLMAEVVKFAKHTLGAERGSFFIIDEENNEMVGHLYDENDVAQDKKGVRLRFDKSQGIAGLVAKTGVTMNIRDAYQDSRFNKEVDQTTGYITRSILCMPIEGVQGVLGVVQVVNKKNGGCFTTNDETLFKTFSFYCALALHYTKSNTQINKMVRQNNIYVKQIHLQQRPCIHDFTSFLNEPNTTIPPGFNDFSWYINDTIELKTKGTRYCLYIMLQLINPAEVHMQNMMQFILTARKLYRDANPYHNFEHAFNVYHCMYAILKRNKSLFSKLEIKALLVAALCHDIDHVGYTNSFLVVIKDDLAQLYQKSILENHHFYVTMMILEDYDIFPTLSESEKKMFRDEIESAILATDLCLYFENKAAMLKMYAENTFDWEDERHRQIVKCIMMTSCDLAGQCKPFLAAKRITENVYREFYHQGDLEKEMGLCPLSLMDRDKKYRIPEDQIQFLNVIVVPCVDLLRIVLPNTVELYNGATTLLKFWIEIAEARGKKVWRQDDSFVRK